MIDDKAQDAIMEAYEKTILEVEMDDRKVLLKKIGNLLAQEMQYGVISNSEWRQIKAAVKKILKVT